MAERLAIVRRVHDGRVELDAVGSCHGCACTGRCAFAATGSLPLALPVAWFDTAPVAGTRVRLSLDDAALRRAATGLYGALLAGLLLGALAGAGLASLAADPIEWVIAAGAGCGTLLAWRLSNRSVRFPAPRIETLPSAETIT